MPSTAVTSFESSINPPYPAPRIHTYALLSAFNVVSIVSFIVDNMVVDSWTEGEWSIMDMVRRDDATETVVAKGVGVGAVS